eukprot:COSAG06_NODE_35513_length_459_cov_0.955556_1_plen_36_part_10
MRPDCAVVTGGSADAVEVRLSSRTLFACVHISPNFA